MNYLSMRGHYLRWESNGELIAERPFYGAERVLLEQRDEAQNECAALREALIELMWYCPRTRIIGGVENWREVPTGTALLKVLDKCEEALKL